MYIVPVAPCTPAGGVRLTGGDRPSRGTVWVCISGTWSTVCDNYWNIPDTRVVCRQLGYGSQGNASDSHYTANYNIVGYRIHCPTAHQLVIYYSRLIVDAQAFASAFYGEGFGPILLDHVTCTGTEATLRDCSHTNHSQCDHSSDAGVDCAAGGGEFTPKLLLQAAVMGCTNYFLIFQDQIIA